MLIISVIVAVTIGITKKKLDSTVSYTYYSAYENLRQVSRTLLADFNSQDEAYQAMLPVNGLANAAVSKPNKYMEMLKSLWIQPAFAAVDPNRKNDKCSPGYIMGEDGICRKGYTPGDDPTLWQGCLLSCGDDEVLVNPNSPNCYCMKMQASEIDTPVSVKCTVQQKQLCLLQGGSFNSETCKCTVTPSGGEECTPPSGGCATGSHWEGDPTCACIADAPSGGDDEECTPPSDGCATGTHWEGDPTCACIADAPSGGDYEPDAVCAAGDTPPVCGQQCVSGQWEAIPNFSNTCNQLTEEWRDLPDCKCVPLARTIPQNGDKLCEEFEKRVNTDSGFDACQGTLISSDTTDFSDKTPDIVLRNGMRIFNLHASVVKLAMLSGNKSGSTISNPALANVNSNQAQKQDFSGSLNLNNNNQYLQVYNYVAQTSASASTATSSGMMSASTSNKFVSNLSSELKANLSQNGFSNEMLQKYYDLGYINSDMMLKYQNPNQFSKLAELLKNFQNIDTGEWGYIVYVDIDGARGGSSTLWEDVYPFYMTLSGQVVPAYNSEGGNDFGGNSKAYLQTSIQYEQINAAGKRKITWLAKSVSFKEGACKSGFIDASTPYCSGINLLTECSSSASDSYCSLKTIKPVKFF